MRLVQTAVLVFVGMTLASQVPAQSLAETAKREKQRRAQLKKSKQSKPAKTFSNEDLGVSGASLANDPSDPPAVVQQPRRAPARRSSPPTRGADRGESYWRSRAQQLRAKLAAAERELAAAEKQVGATGPAGGGEYRVDCKAGRLLMPDGSLGPVTDNCSLAGLRGVESRRAQARLQKAHKGLERARQALVQFKEEARRAGALPGWLR